MDIPTPNLPGRALTPEQKRAIIERVLVAWEVQPQLRLGQLIVNAAALDHYANSLSFDRTRPSERRWYTLWLWRHDESDRRLRDRIARELEGWSK